MVEQNVSGEEGVKNIIKINNNLENFRGVRLMLERLHPLAPS